MKKMTREHGWVCVFFALAILVTTTRAQALGTKIRFQQTLIPADRLNPSPAQNAYRASSGTQTYLSADHALVQINATTVSSFTGSQTMTLTNAAAIIAFTGASASFSSSTSQIRFYDSTNTGGLLVALDGSFNPTLSGPSTVTVTSRLQVVQTLQLSSASGRVQYAGDATVTSNTKTFRLYDDTMTGGVNLSLDGSNNGVWSTTGGNQSFSGGDFLMNTGSGAATSFRVTTGTSTNNIYYQCYVDTPGVCSIGFNYRYVGTSNTPSFQRPNPSKNGYLIKTNQNGAADEFGYYYVNGNTNSDIHSALRLDTTVPSAPYWIASIPLTGSYNWRNVLTSGSGSLSIPSWVTRMYVTAVGAGAAGAAGTGGGAGACILEMPIVVVRTYATTISYSVAPNQPAGSTAAADISYFTYNGITYQAGGGGPGSGGSGGYSGGVLINSVFSPAGASPPYFFGGGGGSAGTATSTSYGYFSGSTSSNGYGAGGSSCMGKGSGDTAATGYGAGGSGNFASTGGYIEIYGVGGI